MTHASVSRPCDRWSPDVKESSERRSGTRGAGGRVRTWCGMLPTRKRELGDGAVDALDDVVDRVGGSEPAEGET